MRIVFTGISGVNKPYVLKRLADFVRQKGKTVAIIDAENRIRDRGKSDYFAYLDSIPADRAVKQWSQSFGTALRDWEVANREGHEPDFSFLSLHACYLVRSHFYCPLNWKYQADPVSNGGGRRVVEGELVAFLKRFDPDLFISLYDNVYSLQARIKDYPFRLLELMKWRNVETLTTDMLADMTVSTTRRRGTREQPQHLGRYKYERSPMIAMRYSLDMIYRFLENTNANRIYMAYPISEPRRVQQESGNDALMRQINLFREFMRTRFIAFDPVSIDERPLKFLWDEFVYAKKRKINRASRNDLARDVRGLLSGSNKLYLKEGALWPTTIQEFDEMLCGPQKEFWNGVGITGNKKQYTLVADEVRQIVEEKQSWQGTEKGGEVDNQIARRDFRLIDQVDCVVIYRPSLNKKAWPEGGTRSEYKYAKDNEKPAVVIRDERDGSFEKPPFETAINPFDIVEGKNLDTDAVSRERCLEQASAKIMEKITESLR